MLFSIYIPKINAALTDETTLNMLIASTGGLFQLFYEVIALIGTYTHASLPRARIHNILSVSTISYPLILLVRAFQEETFSVIWKGANTFSGI